MKESAEFSRWPHRQHYCTRDNLKKTSEGYVHTYYPLVCYQTRLHKLTLRGERGTDTVQNSSVIHPWSIGRKMPGKLTYTQPAAINHAKYPANLF